MFWGDDEVRELQSLVFGPPAIPPNPTARTQVNSLYNVITLSADAHTHWGHGYFTLEPHPDNHPGNLETQRAIFYWVRPNGSSRISAGVYGPIQLTAQLPELSDIGVFAGEDISLYFTDANGRPQFVEDGHTVTFTTPNPDSRPLPSMKLLWLQCTLVRVLRMAGRAGWDAHEVNYSDTDVSSIAGDTVRRSWSQTTALGGRTTRQDNSPEPQPESCKALNNILSTLRSNTKFTRTLWRPKSLSRFWRTKYPPAGTPAKTPNSQEKPTRSRVG